ncbi:HdeD family acid-resistance protein, partial [Mycobacterium sp.]|uniref:HdeD family acid-resistance protein n=1 Tax=Mycobacterium sp. TaxID=1785 RepID=UPI003C7638BE
AISDPDMPGRGWEIFFGVISVLAGIVVMASPIRSLVLLAWLVGIWLIVMGIFEIVSAFGIRKASKRVDDFVERRVAPDGPTA